MSDFNLLRQDLIWGLFDVLHTGGMVMFVLLGMSVLAMTLVLLKLYQFAIAGIFNGEFNRKRALGCGSAIDQQRIQKLKNSANPIVRVACYTRSFLQQNDFNEEKARESVEQYAKNQIQQLNKGLWVLELIASVSPLLGLLGTVFGMIEAFQSLQEAGDRVDPSLLSGGIWQALLTTAAGLVVAIPVLLLYKWLEQCVLQVGYQMEDCVTQLFSEATALEQSKVKVADDCSSDRAEPEMVRA